MVWDPRRAVAALALGLAVVLAGGPGAALAASPEPVFGAASGESDDDGAMTPIGNGRFTVDDRVYVGKSLGRSVGGVAAACFTGQLRSVEDWTLESPRMIGIHAATMTIRSERGTLVLRLRGQMEYPSASGSWEIVRGSGACADATGDGKYTASFDTARERSTFRMTFDGDTQI